VTEDIFIFLFFLAYRQMARKSLPPALKKMSKIVKTLARSGKYRGNIMKAAAKIYRKSARN
jgi:hypothetical protein